MEDYMISLKAARVNKNLTQKQVAELLGVTEQTVSRWESDGEKPSIPKYKDLLRLSDLYGVPVESFSLPI